MRAALMDTAFNAGTECWSASDLFSSMKRARMRGPIKKFFLSYRGDEYLTVFIMWCSEL